MAKEGVNALEGAEKIFLALLTIGLMGLLFLIIYGNLSGNLGFASETTTYTNESSAWINGTPYTMTGKSLAGFLSLSVTVVYNATDGLLISSGNYTVDSTAGTITNTTATNWDPVNITYVVTHKGTPERNTDSVIGNLTSGATEFFTFANVWFILTAITILIGIVLGVIALVRKTSGGGFGGGKSGRSEFPT